MSRWPLAKFAAIEVGLKTKGYGLKAGGLIMNTHRLWRLLFLLALSASADADAVPGKVRNVTTSQAAVGDDVILLRLGNGMEEEARAKTDAQGAFTLNSSSPNAQYVVRVLHQGVNYDQTVI